jgi:hypothetical protein
VTTPTERRPDFDTWMKLVDKAVYARLGCSVHDLPDCCYRDWYDQGDRALTAARKAIRVAEGFEE